MRFTTSAVALLSAVSLASAEVLGRGTNWGGKYGGSGSGSGNHGYGSGSSDEFNSLGCPNTTKPNASPSEQLAAWYDFADLLYTQKNVAGAFGKYVATGYINHAPEIPVNGSAAAVAELSQFVPYSTTFIRNLFVGYNENGTAFGTAHVKFSGGGMPDSALADIIRMIGTCLVEHWDVTTPLNASANPIAYF